ncbi:hypothetical protein [Pleurocapsa sp. FMAR1]|nr:hypothetical protein [Pleurocapsa sp. FMAR1]
MPTKSGIIRYKFLNYGVLNCQTKGILQIANIIIPDGRLLDTISI